MFCCPSHWIQLLTLVLPNKIRPNCVSCACETLRAQNVLRVSSKIELLMFDILVAFVILKWLHQLPVLPHTVLSCVTGGIVTLFKLRKEEKSPSSEKESEEEKWRGVWRKIGKDNNNGNRIWLCPFRSRRPHCFGPPVVKPKETHKPRPGMQSGPHIQYASVILLGFSLPPLIHVRYIFYGNSISLQIIGKCQ